jgi:hypothetical protein
VEDGDNDDQPLDSWINFRDGLIKDEVGVLDASVQPVRSIEQGVFVDHFSADP